MTPPVELTPPATPRPWPSFGRECRDIFTLALPLIAGQLSQMLMGVADTVMVGRLGVVPLGAATFANTVLVGEIVGAHEQPRLHRVLLGGWLYAAGFMALSPLAFQCCNATNAAYSFPRMHARSLLASLILLPTVLLAAGNWPEFRGPTGDGHSDAKGLPIKFGEGERVKWKTPIHGKAWSSPVIWGSQVWLTTANEEGTELSVVMLDKESGKILRDEILFRVAAPQFCHKFNSYASPTPAIEEGRIYVTFGSPGTACLDTKTGKKIWERTDFVCNHYRGAGSSPILWKDLLIMNFDGSDHQFIVALDKKTGKTAWETKRSVDYHDLEADGVTVKNEGDYRKGFATPHVYKQNGQPILLSSGAKAHYAYDPRTGKELWRIDELESHSAATRPVVGHGLAYIPAGFGKAGLLAVKLGGSGALPPESVAWRQKKAVPNKPSVTLLGDLLFTVNDGGIASCLDAKTGDIVWSERLGGNFSASPILSERRLFVGNEEGKFYVFEAGRQFKVLAENQFPDGFMASPAVSGKALYLRSKTALYRIE